MPQDECVDDPSIGDAEILWRYVHPTQIKIDETGERKPFSGVFQDKRSRMSVDIASMTTLAVARLRNPGKFIAQLTVQRARAMKKNVTQQIDKDPSNPAHAVVCPKLSKEEARGISNDPNVWADPPPPEFVPPAPS